MILNHFEQVKLLAYTASAFRGQCVDESEQRRAPLGGKDIAVGVEGESIFGQSGMDTVLEGSSRFGEGHPCAGQFAGIADITRCDPDRGEFAQVKQGSQAMSVQFVGLVDVAHHDLRLGGVSQQREAAGGFDLFDDPVPVADCLECHGGATRERLQEGMDGSGDVADAGAVDEVPFGVQHSKHRIVLVGITTDRIIGVEHAAPPVSRQGFDTPSLAGGAVLSYNHLVGCHPSDSIGKAWDAA